MNLSLNDSLSMGPSESGSRGLSVSQVAQSGLMVALLAVAAQVSVVIGPVPFTLQTLVVTLIALVFAPGQAALTIAAYLLLGAAGVPVFSSMRAGIAHILGPTGGYLYGYIASVVLGALARRAICNPENRAAQPVRSVVADAVCAAIVLAVCYTTGTLHFMALGALGGNPYDALYVLAVCVFPFIVPDVLKAAAAILIATALRRAVQTE